LTDTPTEGSTRLRLRAPDNSQNTTPLNLQNDTLTDREQDDGTDLERELVLGDRVPGFD
jgi:hypothetical protein